jgi:Family of unknown function (DUF6308)
VDDADTLRVEREDGELLVLDGLALVRGFVSGDLSARPGGYNDQAGRGERDAISLDDIVLVNSTMRSRAEHARWLPVIEADQSWLSRIPNDLDIVESDDAAWAAADGDRLVHDAIARCIRPYIALARSTKVLHLKRPRLFPVLDELALQMMGVPIPTKAGARVAAAKRVTSAIRREARRNIEPLRHIQARLRAEGSRLSLVRLFDIALWFSHPAAGVDNATREIVVRLRN